MPIPELVTDFYNNRFPLRSLGKILIDKESSAEFGSAARWNVVIGTKHVGVLGLGENVSAVRPHKAGRRKADIGEIDGAFGYIRCSAAESNLCELSSILLRGQMPKALSLVGHESECLNAPFLDRFC